MPFWLVQLRVRQWWTDWLPLWIARHLLPKHLVYWCYIVVVAKASSGPNARPVHDECFRWQSDCWRGLSETRV